MALKVTPTAIPEVLVVEPQIFADERGFFFESFNQQAFNQALGAEVHFVQDNHSKSKQGVLRGIHYQLNPHAQGKLVRVVSGSVYDVAVDLRRSSKTFGQWVGVELSADNKKQLWIPDGFGHAFLTLSESAEFLYKTTDYYSSVSERSIRWDDAQLAIIWPKLDVPLSLSEKDLKAKLLAEADLF
jgi:dTDP-4-dehydrorhamnose 3,5-epimerase